MAATEKLHQISLDEKLMVAIVRASELFKKKSSSIFRKYGLTFSQYNVLMNLIAREGGKDTITNISKGLLVTGANMTGLAKRLERDGFIEKNGDPADERRTILKISEKGRRTLQIIRQEQEIHVAAYLKNYSGSYKQDLLSVMKHIIRTVSSG